MTVENRPVKSKPHVAIARVFIQHYNFTTWWTKLPQYDTDSYA